MRIFYQGREVIHKEKSKHTGKSKVYFRYKCSLNIKLVASALVTLIIIGLERRFEHRLITIQQKL